MALFDAASPEEARRRNQKKDASVVKKMERLSHLVEPAEVTYSAAWSPRKNRHINDLDDASSLIDGESPMMLKPKPKAKRKVLGSISGNVGRPSKRKSKAASSPKKSLRQPRSTAEPELPKLPPLDHTRARYHSAYSVCEDSEEAKDEDDRQFKAPYSRQRSVFDDQVDVAEADSPFQRIALLQSYGRPAPRFPFQTPAWLRPASQNPLFLDTHYNDFGTDDAVEALQHASTNRPNDRVDVLGHGHNNPLAWPSPRTAPCQHNTSLDPSFGPFSGFISGFGLPDPFTTTKNPLADPFNHFSEDGPVGQPARTLVQP